MSRQTRRSFLQRTTAKSAAATALAWTGGLNAAGANKRVTVGLIGCGGQGAGLARAFSKIAQVAYVCDPDPAQRRRVHAEVGAQHSVEDLRRVLDDPAVDAVVIATPDHWHAPAAILACEAGKHVYVEKPQSHNLQESRWLVDAARRHQRVVQHGTQSRSSPLIANAVQMLREGVIGDVLVAKAWNIQRRSSIGRATPGNPPPGVNYDLWVGPAEFLPYQPNRFHKSWRWWHNFGTGDIGNDGTHEIDYARWGLGVEGTPQSVMASGGKYYFDDDQQFPDTATCSFTWPGDGRVGSRRQLIFEMRIWSPNYPFNCDSGAEFYGTAGRMMLSKRGKLEVYDERNRRVDDPRPERRAAVTGNHQADFLDAIRSQRSPSADVAIGHDTMTLVHLANVAIKVGRSCRVDPRSATIVDDPDAAQLLGRRYRDGGHWAVPG
jgi:predicted dehydrogenase